MITSLYDVIKEDTNNNTKLYLIKDFDQVLSLNLLKEDEISQELKKYIEEKINERNIAKKNKDYTKADQIRDELLKQNIIIKDTREGTTFEIQK